MNNLLAPIEPRIANPKSGLSSVRLSRSAGEEKQHLEDLQIAVPQLPTIDSPPPFVSPKTAEKRGPITPREKSGYTKFKVPNWSGPNTPREELILGTPRGGQYVK